MKNNLTTEQIEQLEKMAEFNDGHCDRCGQTIKIYRYKLNKVHAQFMRAMASEVRNTGVNDVDISTIGLAYSVRSQNSKLRQHGLIARVKNEKGAQIARRWLVTHKGWTFLNGGSVASKVVVFNNQVLGHDAPMVTMHEILGEVFNPDTPTYEETPVSQPEARTYKDVRTPQKYMSLGAQFKGRDYQGKFKVSRVYVLKIKQLVVGKPVEITAIDEQPNHRVYNDIAAFQRDWKIV